MYARQIERRPAAPGGEAAAPAANPARTPAAAQPGSSAVVALFLLAVCLSAPFTFAGVQLFAARIMMLVMFVPLIFFWIGGKAGGVTRSDVFFCLFVFWIFVAIIVNDGFSQFNFAAVNMVEILGAYLLGRWAIRSAADYARFFKFHFIAMLCLFPFIFPEMATSNAIMQDFKQAFLGASYSDVNHDPRMGLWRVQSVFQHPILFGIFCSIAISNWYYLFKPRWVRSFGGAGFALFMTYTSLSSGPFLAGVSQIGLILWGVVTRNRWKVLTYGCLAVFVFLSVASNRGPFIIAIETLAFSSSTGWTRVIQFIHGMEEVRQNPVFGLGMGDWDRPGWLGGSVDNFWLLMAMRYGVVGFAFLVVALVFNYRAILKAPIEDSFERNCRLGYLVGCVSLFLTLATVHVWSEIGLLVMFYFGAGSWMYTGGLTIPASDPGTEQGAEPSRPERTRPRRTPEVRRPGPAVRERPAAPTTRPRRLPYRRHR